MAKSEGCVITVYFHSKDDNKLRGYRLTKNTGTWDKERLRKERIDAADFVRKLGGFKEIHKIELQKCYFENDEDKTIEDLLR